MSRKIVTLAVLAVLAGMPADAAEPGSSNSAGDLSTATTDRGEAYYYLMRALYVAREGQSAEAIRNLRAALKLEPDSADLKAEAASLLYALGQRSDAERQARAALEIDPQHSQALRLLAEIVLNRAMASGGDTDGIREAIGLYERLAAVPDADVEVYHILGGLKLRLGDVEGAVEAGQILVSKRPGNAQGVQLLVRAYLQSGRASDAVDALIGFVVANPGLEPDHPELTRTVDFLGQLVRQEGAWSTIEVHGEGMTEAHPRVAELHLMYGEALLRSGRNAEAVDQLEIAAELSSDEDAELDFYLATAYGSMGRLADAVELAGHLAEQIPDHGGVLNLLGEVQAQRGEVDQAIAALTAAIAAFGDEPMEMDRRDVLRRRVASMHLLRQEVDAASKILDQLENPGSIDSLESRAVLAMEVADYDRVKQLARRLRSTGNEGVGLGLALEAEALARTGKEAKATAKFEEAATELGGRVWGRAADVFREIDRPEIGERLLRAWVASEPENPGARFRLGSHLERTGNFDAARSELARAIELAPDHAEALNYLGYSLADRDRDLEKALALIERALEIDPWNGAYLDSLGWVYFRMGRFPEAQEPLERAAREFPRDSVVLEHLGDVYVRLGDPERAVRVWTRALDVNGENAAEIRQKISAHSDAADLSPESDDVLSHDARDR